MQMGEMPAGPAPGELPGAVSSRAARLGRCRTWSWGLRRGHDASCSPWVLLRAGSEAPSLKAVSSRIYQRGRWPRAGQWEATAGHPLTWQEPGSLPGGRNPWHTWHTGWVLPNDEAVTRGGDVCSREEESPPR